MDQGAADQRACHETDGGHHADQAQHPPQRFNGKGQADHGRAVGHHHGRAQTLEQAKKNQLEKREGQGTGQRAQGKDQHPGQIDTTGPQTIP